MNTYVPTLVPQDSSSAGGTIIPDTVIPDTYIPEDSSSSFESSSSYEETRIPDTHVPGSSSSEYTQIPDSSSESSASSPCDEIRRKWKALAAEIVSLTIKLSELQAVIERMEADIDFYLAENDRLWDEMNKAQTPELKAQLSEQITINQRNARQIAAPLEKNRASANKLLEDIPKKGKELEELNKALEDCLKASGS